MYLHRLLLFVLFVLGLCHFSEVWQCSNKIVARSFVGLFVGWFVNIMYMYSWGVFWTLSLQ